MFEVVTIGLIAVLGVLAGIYIERYRSVRAIEQMIAYHRKVLSWVRDEAHEMGRMEGVQQEAQRNARDHVIDIQHRLG